MKETTLLGYRAKTHVNGWFLCRDGYGVFSTPGEPTPATLPEVYKRIAEFLEKYPSAVVPEVVKVESIRELTPIECASRALGEQLLALTE